MLNTNLTEQDQARIAAIEKYLGDLYRYLPDPHATVFTPIAPVEETKRVVALGNYGGIRPSQYIQKGEQYDVEKEDEHNYYINGFGFSKDKLAVLSPTESAVEEAQYFRCARWDGEFYTEGNVYEVANGIIVDNRGVEDKFSEISGHFKPSTIEAFTAQNTIAQTEWKENDFVQQGAAIGIVTQVMNDRVLATNLNGGWAMNVTFDKAIKPTQNSIENTLKTIAIKKYPVGTKYKVKYQNEAEPRVITNDGFKYSPCRWSYDHDKEIQSLDNNGLVVWDNIDGWASILEVEPIKEERWRPTQEDEEYYYLSDTFEVQTHIYQDGLLDMEYIEAGNYFKTRELAQEAATKIKQLLKQG